MKMMMEVTEYVELPGILTTWAAFAEALYLARGVFKTDAIEWRVPSAVARELMRVVYTQYPATTAQISADGVLRVMGLPVAVVQQAEHVRLIFKTETLGVSRVQ